MAVPHAHAHAPTLVLGLATMLAGSMLPGGVSGTCMGMRGACWAGNYSAWGVEPDNLNASLTGSYNFSPYTPGNSVVAFHKNTFPHDLSGADSAEYFGNTTVEVLWFIVLGVVVLAWLGVCACGEVGCCVKKNDCCARFLGGNTFKPACAHTHPGKRGLVVCTCLAMGLLAVFILCLMILTNEYATTAAIDGLGGVLVVLDSWPTIAQNGLGDVLVSVGTVDASATMLISVDLHTSTLNNEADGAAHTIAKTLNGTAP